MIRDDPPTPRLTPFLSTGPVLSQLANDYAMRCDEEASKIGGTMPHRGERCRDLAMHMRARMVEFDRWTKKPPPTAGECEETMAKFRDLEVQVRALRLPAGKLTT